jgi:hypothetical protein
MSDPGSEKKEGLRLTSEREKERVREEGSQCLGWVGFFEVVVLYITV